jgi:hypothetical protein
MQLHRYERGAAMGAGVAFGLCLPMFERPIDGEKPTWTEIGAMAERAEELGFDSA